MDGPSGAPAAPASAAPRPPNHHGVFRALGGLAAPYWRGERRWHAWGHTVALVLLGVALVLLAMWINLWTAELFDALERRSAEHFIQQVAVFALIVALSMAANGANLVVKRRIQLAWREALTRRVVGGWMARARHYQIALVPGDHDNPDGRIAEDIRITTETAVELGQSLLYCALLLIAFTGILWALSGTVEVFGLPVPGHMVGLAMLYAAAGSAIAFLLGRRLVRATDRRQGTEADFRFCLARARGRRGHRARARGGRGARPARRAVRHHRGGVEPADHVPRAPDGVLRRLRHPRARVPDPGDDAALPGRRGDARRVDAGGAGLPAGHRGAVLAGGQFRPHRGMACLGRSRARAVPRDGGAGRRTGRDRQRHRADRAGRGAAPRRAGARRGERGRHRRRHRDHARGRVRGTRARRRRPADGRGGVPRARRHLALGPQPDRTARGRRRAGLPRPGAVAPGGDPARGALPSRRPRRHARHGAARGAGAHRAAAPRQAAGRGGGVGARASAGRSPAPGSGAAAAAPPRLGAAARRDRRARPAGGGSGDARAGRGTARRDDPGLRPARRAGGSVPPHAHPRARARRRGADPRDTRARVLPRPIRHPGPVLDWMREGFGHGR